MKKQLATLFLSVSLTSPLAYSSHLPTVLEESNQLILIVGKSENSTKASLETWEKINGKWKQVNKTHEAVLGRNGLATGLGLSDDELFSQTVDKVEGDGKTPTGIFDIGQVYGKKNDSKFGGSLPYTEATKDIIGIDDPNSKYYNKIIRKSSVASPDWNSHEKIYKFFSNTYKWLLEIGHNPQNIPKKGSLIFLHGWRTSHYKTAGCVALKNKNLLNVLRWINPAKKPKLAVIEYKNEVSFKKLLK
jgi:L,D-peptidoglycan transpeptidase YkuD (ErfK/YbiS/YcfS/YnhG family)